MDIAHFIVFPGFFEFCLYSWWDLWAHKYLAVAHHPTYHDINLVCRANFCIPHKYICSEGGKNPNPETNTQANQTSSTLQDYAEDKNPTSAARTSWGSLQAHTETRAGSEWLCDRELEREEGLKLKLLLQLCICSESLLWLTLPVFTLASAQMEQLWQQKKQVVLLITCCSRQLHQDFFLPAQMKQRRLYWALLLLLVLPS